MASAATVGVGAAALHQFAALLPVMKRVLGAAEQSVTLAALNNLARFTGDTGDPFAARDQFAELLAIREDLSRAEHPDTLTARASLAYWTEMAGAPVAARDQYAELLPVLRKVLGDQHPDTLAADDNLAYWRRRAETSGWTKLSSAIVPPCGCRRFLWTGKPTELLLDATSLIAAEADDRPHDGDV